MNTLRATTIDYYGVLGISRSSTLGEVKKAYRKKAHETHPDRQEDSNDTAAFRVVQEAYEWLLANHVPTEEVTRDDSSVELRTQTDVNGHPATIVTRKTEWWTDVWIEISLEVAKALGKIDIIRFDHEQPRQVYVIKDGATLFSAYIGYLGHMHDPLEKCIRRYEKGLRAERYNEKLDTIANTMHDLERLGRPTIVLAGLLEELRSSLRRFDRGYRVTDESALLGRFTACENEIKRIEAGGSQILIDGLLDGSITHPSMWAIQQVIDAVKQYSIRSNGFIEPIDETMLRRHLERKVGSFESIIELRRINLALSLEDYAPAEILEALAADMAPESIEVARNKGFTSYPVEYTEVAKDGCPVKAGVITMPLSIYEKHAYEYGKPSSLPQLPHGIELYLKLTNDNKPVAQGFEGEVLNKKIKKYRTSRNRGKAIEDIGVDELYGRRYRPMEATPLPPHYVGKTPRW